MKSKLALIIVIGAFLLIQPLGAQTWEATKRLTWNSGDSEFPVIAVGTNDHIHVVWQDETPGNLEIFYKRSTNGGTTWTTKRLTYNPNKSESPAIAADTNNHIHVVWSNDYDNDYEIFYKKSTNGGANWITKRLTYNYGYSDDPAIATDTNNHIHVVWENEGPGGWGEIYYKKSTDGGTTWTTKRLSYSAGVSMSSDIVVDSNSRIHIVYRDDTYEEGLPEIFYKMSTDGGTTWTTRRLTWNLGGSWGPAIATDSNDHIHLTWSDDDFYRCYLLLYRRSTDGGATWTTKRITANCELSVGPADIAVDSNNHILVVWGDKTPGNREIYYKKSTDAGVNWSETKRLTWDSGASDLPSIAVDSSDRIHLVWHDNTLGNYEIYYKKGIQ